MIGILGKKVKCIIQAEDGTTFDISSCVTQIDVQTMLNERVKVDIEMIGNSAMLQSTRNEYLEITKDKKSSSEWKCDFCGRPNKKADETCKSCGAVRSFIYDIPVTDIKPNDIVMNIDTSFTDLELENIARKTAEVINAKCKEKNLIASRYLRTKRIN
ncbi:MAG: hypothetical protein WC998_01400 [Candidatus Paceibacterota bacterium]|jgi:hypothetical protein